MTGWRIGYAGGPRHVIRAMKTIQSQITSNPCSISQAAAAAALDGAQDCVAEMTAQYKQRSDYLVGALNKLPGFECRHNRNYWTFGDYVGIGAGAHGKITFADGRIERYAKRRQPEDYMSAAQNRFEASRRTLEHDEIAGEFVLNALRLNNGFRVDDYQRHTGLSLASLQPQLKCQFLFFIYFSGDSCR